MDDEAAVEYYSTKVPVDDTLLAPLGKMTWAAIRLHGAVRDTLGVDLGDGLSDKPFARSLGQVISDLGSRARACGDPWDAQIDGWITNYGEPAVRFRDRITHAIAYTAPDGLQALRTSPYRKHPVSERVTVGLLGDATGRLVLAAVRLAEAREKCRSSDA